MTYHTKLSGILHTKQEYRFCTVYVTAYTYILQETIHLVKSYFKKSSIEKTLALQNVVA